MKLIRFFEKKEYAELFTEGKIRFGEIKVYRRMEGKRQDKSEGTCSFTWNTCAPSVNIDRSTGKIISGGISSQNIKLTGLTAHTIYILCTSRDKVKLENHNFFGENRNGGQVSRTEMGVRSQYLT
jgi:hypothetical protein